MILSISLEREYLRLVIERFFAIPSGARSGGRKAGPRP
jgi:hypothetical protein